MVIEQFSHAELSQFSFHSSLQSVLELLFQSLSGLANGPFGRFDVKAQLPPAANSIEHLLNTEMLSGPAQPVAATATTLGLNQMGMAQLQQDLLQTRFR